MDDKRFQELIRKRDSSGLTSDEANELGRMIAERDGAPYSNASEQGPPEGDADEERPYSEAELKDLKEYSDVQDAPEEAEKAT
ncbi:MAG TPA: hypothetical protein VGR13_08395 [Actinomycetota bacterium]|jgi:hypothetical protein|nr:hypothetical protein [Actinomycetota bacterium]